MSHREVEEQIIREMEMAAQNEGADKVCRLEPMLSCARCHKVRLRLCA